MTYRSDEPEDNGALRRYGASGPPDERVSSQSREAGSGERAETEPELRIEAREKEQRGPGEPEVVQQVVRPSAEAPFILLPLPFQRLLLLPRLSLDTDLLLLLSFISSSSAHALPLSPPPQRLP